MFKRLVAVILALVVVLGGMGKPAYAYSGNILQTNLEVSNASSLSEMSLPSTESASGKVLPWVVKTAGEAVISFGAVAAVCMAADAAASAVFPPAAALLPYCPAVGGAFGGGVAIRKTALKGIGVKTVTALAQ